MKIALLTIGLLLAGTQGAMASSALIVLNGGGFLQSGTVTNNASSTANIVQATYSLGAAAADNLAVWEVNLENPAGTRSSFLTGSHYLSYTFTGLSVAPGGSFNFSGFDIDLIVTAVPLSITGGIIDNVGTSLRDATFTVVWDDGTTGFAELFETGWTVSQTLRIGPADPVPAPAALSLLGLGLAALGLRRR